MKRKKGFEADGRRTRKKANMNRIGERYRIEDIII